MTEFQAALTFILSIANFALCSGACAFLFRLNYKWNVVLDRNDLMYKQYCDEHNIPFVGLKNDY
jgi:hypothetical protein